MEMPKTCMCILNEILETPNQWVTAYSMGGVLSLSLFVSVWGHRELDSYLHKLF